MDIPHATLRLSPRQQPTVLNANARPGSAAERDGKPTLDAQPSDKPLMLRQALSFADANQAPLSAGQPSWFANAKIATSPEPSAPHKAAEGDASQAGHLDTAVSRHIAARDLHDEARLEEAHLGYLDALDLYRSALGAEHAYIAICQIDIGWLLSAQGKHALALGNFRDALAMQEELLEPGHPHLAVARSAIADMLQTLGNDH